MKKNKIACEIFHITDPVLFLTAGYAQALPDLSSFGYRSASSTSDFNLIASTIVSGCSENPHVEYSIDTGYLISQLHFKG